MRRRAGWLGVAAAVALPLAGCADETVSGYVGREGPWRLVELDGAAFAARATIAFPEPGRIAGEAPCNVFSGAIAVPYPWFALSGLAVTRRACPDLAAEGAFFAALQAMRQAEVSGDVLVLTAEDGRQMVFRAVPEPG